jgi:transcriptional regulator with XRE-family HTH domain
MGNDKDTGIDLRIKELCKAKGMGIQELADKVGMSRVSIGNFVARRQWPSSEAIRKIADALDVEVYELFRPSGETKGFTCPHCGKVIEISIK